MAIRKTDMNISEDMKKLKTLLKKVPKERQAIANSLYKELMFMQNTLSILKFQVQDEGPTAMFKQGSQEFLRQHPALTGYIAMIQKYSLVYKQICDLLPTADTTAKGDPLMDFIKGK